MFTLQYLQCQFARRPWKTDTPGQTGSERVRLFPPTLTSLTSLTLVSPKETKNSLDLSGLPRHLHLSSSVAMWRAPASSISFLKAYPRCLPTVKEWNGRCMAMSWSQWLRVCVCVHVAILCSCSSLENTQVWAVDAEFHLMHQELRNNKVVTRDVGRGAITAEHVSSKTSSYISIHQPKPCPTDHEQKNPVFEASTDCFTRCNCFETGRS